MPFEELHEEGRMKPRRRKKSRKRLAGRSRASRPRSTAAENPKRVAAGQPRPGWGLLFPDPHTNTIAYTVQTRAIRALERAARIPLISAGEGRLRTEREAPAAVSKRGKLSPAALDEHLRRHPINKRHADGSWFSARDRVRVLKRDQDITIDRSTLAKRLGPYSHPITTS
jgi:hypothetical protein